MAGPPANPTDLNVARRARKRHDLFFTTIADQKPEQKTDRKRNHYQDYGRTFAHFFPFPFHRAAAPSLAIAFRLRLESLRARALPPFDWCSLASTVTKTIVLECLQESKGKR